MNKLDNGIKHEVLESESLLEFFIYRIYKIDDQMLLLLVDIFPMMHSNDKVNEEVMESRLFLGRDRVLNRGYNK